MYLKINNYNHPCAGFSRCGDEVRIRLTGDNHPETLADAVAAYKSEEGDT